MVVGVLATVTAVFAIGMRGASADAGRGVGLTNIVTNQFLHPWQGGWVTDVGTAWCIQSGAREPRAVGNVQIGDVPASRGVGLQDRWALAYALWRYSDTPDPVTGAAMATLVRGLSGDEWADVNVPAMSVSDPVVKAKAIEIYNEAQQRAHWLEGPWSVSVSLEWQGGTTWQSTIRFTNASGQPIAGHAIEVLPDNVVETEGSGVVRGATTDANGVVVSTWHQNDVSQDIVIVSGAWAPAYYTVWAGPNYPSGSSPQNLVTENGARFDGGSRSRIPTGLGRIHKVTTNPAYQSATGATYDVRPVGGGESLGVLNVGIDGFSNSLDLMPGTYEIVETSAPQGVRIDPTVHEVVVRTGELTTIELVDGVEPAASMKLMKLDVATGERIGGAVVSLKRDSDDDGVYDEDIGTFTLGPEPMEIGYLLAGNYQVTEVEPPDGYLIDQAPTRYLTLAWNETATVSFEDHRIPSFATRTEQVDGNPDVVKPPSGGSDGKAVGDITVELGARFRDVVVVEGLADDEAATVHLELFGPFDSLDDLTGGCTEDARVWSDEFEVKGSGAHPSAPFTASVPGVYGYVATLVVPGVGEYAGKCGDVGESVTVEEVPTETETETEIDTQVDDDSGGVSPEETTRRPTIAAVHELPRTGIETRTYLLMGLVLVAVGSVVVLLTRRLSKSTDKRINP